MKHIYLDYNATTPLDPQVIEVIESCMQDTYGNPSSVHAQGRRARVLVENAREEVASLINAQNNEIFFTSGGTEANNLAIQGVYFKERNRGNHIITTKLEHPSVLASMKFLEKHGADILYVSVDPSGKLDLYELEQTITDKTILVSIMLANNEIGNWYPIKSICEIAHARKAIVHTDAVQAVGKISVDVQNLGVDLLSFSGHKLYGPKGIGALYIRKGISIEPLIHGGSQERGIRGGTENTIALAGFGKAAKLARENLYTEMERIHSLKKKLEFQILEKIADSYINGDRKNRLPGTSNIRLSSIEGEALLLNLDLSNISISSGSACSSGSLEPSHVLLAMGLSKKDAKSSVRISLGRFTTEEEVDIFLETLPPIVERLRNIAH